MEIFIENLKACEISAEVIVAPIWQEQDNENECLDEFYQYAKNENGFCGKYLDMSLLPTYKKITPKNILFVGMGKKEEFNHNKLRIAISKALQKAQTIKKVEKVTVVMPSFDEETVIIAEAMVEGALIGLYKFDKYKTEKNNNIATISILSNENNEDVQKGIELGQLISKAVNDARDLINEPAEIITPEKLSQIALNINGIETKIYSRDEAKEMGMGAFLAVGQGSRHEQKFIHMKYTPENKKASIALIGKGITFDSGGLDIKPASSMLEMKGDMAGAAAILSVMQAITTLQPDVEVHGIIAACENMPASHSYKPGDILTAMNGKTIEVDNTDAEGRLTLADALCFAENLNPDAIIDIATLTGACCVALGKVASGLLGNDDELIENLQLCAEDSGEYLWEMPMYEEYFEDLKSDIADFKNSGSRYGGTSAAALFLKHFVKNTPWAHIDIAGTSILNKPLREYTKGATGVGVRTLINYILHV